MDEAAKASARLKVHEARTMCEVLGAKSLPSMGDWRAVMGMLLYIIQALEEVTK